MGYFMKWLLNKEEMYGHVYQEKWFDIGTEILVVNDAEEAIDVYEWLLSDEEERDKLANNAYERVLRDHTFRSRAIDLLKNFEAISSST